MFKKIAYLSIIFFIVINVSACKKPEKNRYEAEFIELFDTVTQVIGYADSKESFSETVQKIYDELKVYHELYDIYNDYEGINNVKTINDNAGIKPVKVDQKIIDLLKFGREVDYMSESSVNIALGSVLKIWHDHRELGIKDPVNATIPDIVDLVEAAKHIDINDMIIDEESKTVYLKDPAMSLDVGGIAKGYATEQISLFAISEGMTDGLISVGGNVRTFGYKGKDGDLWNIGIQNPESGEADIYSVQITNCSLVTSGDYIRYYTVGGERYHHIIDPKTLMPSEHFTAVTIICEDSGMADTLSTMLFNMDFVDGLEYIESKDDTEAVWIFKDGSREYSSGFEALLR